MQALVIVLIGMCMSWSVFSIICPQYERDIVVSTREVKKSPKVEMAGKETVDVHPGQIVTLNGQPVGFARPTKQFILMKAWVENQVLVYMGIFTISLFTDTSVTYVLGFYGLAMYTLFKAMKNEDDPNYYRVDNLFALTMYIPMIVSLLV